MITIESKAWPTIVATCLTDYAYDPDLIPSPRMLVQEDLRVETTTHPDPYEAVLLHRRCWPMQWSGTGVPGLKLARRFFATRPQAEAGKAAAYTALLALEGVRL